MRIVFPTRRNNLVVKNVSRGACYLLRKSAGSYQRMQIRTARGNLQYSNSSNDMCVTRARAPDDLEFVLSRDLYNGGYFPARITVFFFFSNRVSGSSSSN